MIRGRAIGYLLISSESQNSTRQLDGLRLEMVFIDDCSGKNTDRPGLTALLDYLRPHDTLYVDSMGLLGRNLDELFGLVQGLIDRSVSVVFVKNKANEKLMLSMPSAVAGSEQEMTRERQAEWIARVKSLEPKKGRPPKLSSEQVVRARRQIEAGMQQSLVARKLGVSRTTLHKHLKKESVTPPRFRWRTRGSSYASLTNSDDKGDVYAGTGGTSSVFVDALLRTIRKA